MLEAINLTLLLELAAFLLVAISLLPLLRRPVLQLADAIEREIGLSFWDKVWIFILYVIAMILTILAGLGIATGIGLLILLLLAAFFTLLATFWWLFEIIIWPWDPEFWKIVFDHPWIAFFLGALVLVPLALIIALLLGASLPVLILVGLAVALWWLIFVWRCGWVIWLQSKLIPFVAWFWKTLRFLFEVTVEVTTAVHRWFTEARQEWRQIRVRRCASWVWWLRWICTGFTYVMEFVLVTVEIVVHVIVWVVMIIVMLIWLVISILVSIVVLVPLFIIKLIFWCW